MATTRHDRALTIFGGPDGLAAVDAYVNRIADSAPPLTPAQLDRLRVLLRPASSADRATTAPLKHAA